MNFNRLILLAIAICFGTLASTAQAKKQELPEVTEDGLHRIHDSKLAIVYAEPGANLSQYSKVDLLEAYVAFKKNWERDQRTRSAQPLRISSRDIERIKNTLAQEFHQVFVDELTKGGYEVVDEAGDDVLLVRPAIINLDVNAPDTPTAGRTTSYTSSAGEMTLYVELYDSVTGDLIAKALDRKIDQGVGGFYTWTNSVTNKAAADRILRGWAVILRKALDEARSHPPVADTDSD